MASEESATGNEQDEQWGVHFISALGIELWPEDGITHGRAELKPEMWAPGTHMPRIGVLATMVDVVAGSLPTGPVNPTVDLRVSLLSPPPSEGVVLMRCQPLKPLGQFVPIDLDVRYLNRMRTPSAVATAEVLPGDLSARRTRVPITESGDGGRIVSLVSILWNEQKG